MSQFRIEGGKPATYDVTNRGLSRCVTSRLKMPSGGKGGWKDKLAQGLAKIITVRGDFAHWI
jgi:hypothetical protein